MGFLAVVARIPAGSREVIPQASEKSPLMVFLDQSAVALIILPCPF